ncbi:hypothetical protein LINGRAHAP2_LOCUS15664, partial [Linum grandiflorum]
VCGLSRTETSKWDDVRGCVLADDAVFAGWVKTHPRASGLNHKPLPYWDDLCFIFGLDQAVAADAVQPSDAASKLVAGDGVSDYMEMGAERVDLYTIPADMDHDDVMADLINQGIDLDATGLKDVEAEITSKRVQMKGKQAASSSGSKRSRQQFSEDNYCQIVASISAANENLEKIATNYCIEVDLAVKRQPIPRAFEVH